MTTPFAIEWPTVDALGGLGGELLPETEVGLNYLIDGKVERWGGASEPVRSPICVRPRAGADAAPHVLGPAAILDEATARRALDAAVRAYDRGRGRWPTMRVEERIERLQAFAAAMTRRREEVVRLLMWEIAKTRGDSEKEFDRTVAYVADTVEALKEQERSASRFSSRDGVLALVRRAPLGVVLSMGPFNYPLNETYTTLIPALVMGNTIVAKLPKFGALCQGPLLEAFAECFPPGVVNVVNGDGPTVVGPLMASGDLASLAFIGTARVANILKKQHPRPNRLRCVLGLEAKNPAIVLEDADLDVAVKECVTGALSFNGQRCTGLKIIFVQRKIADPFVAKLADAVEALPFGVPWAKEVRLTPLPEPGKPAWLAGLVDDAVAAGARVANPRGGAIDQTFYFPSIVYPVRAGARLWSEEQFGPVIPVAPFDDPAEVIDWVVQSPYGQQAALFGRDPDVVGPLVDVLVNQVCRVNLNAQCQRGPDVYPFTGRKDSAEGTLSVSDALRCFSIRTMVATPAGKANQTLLREILNERSSGFVNTDYLF